MAPPKESSASKEGPKDSSRQSPLPCVDIIVERFGKVLLIERLNPPFGFALPGGFVDYGESLEQAAKRELKEETGLDTIEIEQFHAYSDPSRDPRFHTLSVVFLALTKGEAKANDDAKALEFFPLDSLPTLCFDHGIILKDYIEARKEGIITTLQKKQAQKLAHMPESTKSWLLALSRQAVTHYLKHGVSRLPLDLEIPDEEPLLYAQPYGLFVTLRIEGKLRGCIGSLGTFKPLYELVWTMAIQAAFFDPRFDPLSYEELPSLDFEVSILTPPTSIKDLTLIEIGRHGLLMENGPYRGLLLPQVALDLELDPVGFLEAVSSKAGLKKDAWMDFYSRIHTFEAYTLKEEQKA